jgi:hypothetical protein
MIYNSYCNLDYIERLEKERTDLKREWYGLKLPENTSEYGLIKAQLDQLNDYINRYKRYGTNQKGW